MGSISAVTSYLINGIEIVQQRAARWVKQEYGTITSKTSILNNLAILSECRQHSRPTIFFKLFHQDPFVIQLPQHYLPFTLT